MKGFFLVKARLLVRFVAWDPRLLLARFGKESVPEAVVPKIR